MNERQDFSPAPQLTVGAVAEAGAVDAQCNADNLVRLLKAGDIEVLDRVTRCFGQRLLAEARRRCQSPHQAQDAVQDAALNAWRYGPGFRGEGSVERWLVRLVASTCNRMRRGVKNDPTRHVPDEALVADEATPEMLAARSKLGEQIAHALAQLPPRDRAIVLLADGEGQTGPEIAAALGMTAGAVRTRLSRSHARLRKLLSNAREDGP